MEYNHTFVRKTKTAIQSDNVSRSLELARKELDAYDQCGESQRLTQAEIYLITAERCGGNASDLRQRLSSYGYRELNSALVEC